MQIKVSPVPTAVIEYSNTVHSVRDDVLGLKDLQFTWYCTALCALAPAASLSGYFAKSG